MEFSIKMPKVLISAYTACPNRGSEPGNGWNWILQYVNNNFDVNVVTSARYRREIEEYIAFNESTLKFHFVDNKMLLKALTIPVLGTYLHYYLWLFNCRRYILLRLKNYKFDHFHHVTYSSIKFGTPVYNLNKPSIIGPLGGTTMPHISLKKYFGIYWYAELAKNVVSNLLAHLNPTVKKSINSSFKLLVSNTHTKAFVDKYSPQSVEFMFDAGLSDDFNIAYPNKGLDPTITILWAGKIIPRKGLNLAVESFSELIKIDDNFKLIIVGDGPLKTKVERLVCQLNIIDKVSFYGHVSYKEMLVHYKNSHIFLFPSLKDSCPMQVFEAMALGLPVVTLDHQGMHDQVIEGVGLKIPIGDVVSYPLELARAMFALSNNPEIYNRYSKAAYLFGQKQLWSRRIKSFLNTDMLTEINNAV